MKLKMALAAMAPLLVQIAAFGAPEQHFLLLQTGSDWCVSGEDVRRTFESKRFKSELAEGVDWNLAVYDDMENPTPAVAAANKKLAHRRVETRRFPALTCTGPDTRDGSVRFFAQFENLPRDIGGRKLAGMVSRALENKRRAEALFAKGAKLRAADDPSGAADAYGEGFDLLLSQAGAFFSSRIYAGLHSYAADWKALQELDKDDRYGWKMHFTMSEVKLVEKATGFAKFKNFDGGVKYIEGLRKIPQTHFSPDQKQCIDIAEFALWRTTPGREALNAALLEHALSLGRDTFWGQCALGALVRMGRKFEKRPRFRAKVRPRPAEGAATGRKTWENAVKRDRKSAKAPSPAGAKAHGMTDAAKLEIARAAVARRIGDSPVWDRPGSKAFAEEFLNDTAWMEDFAWSGDADWAKAILALESLVWQDAGRWHVKGRNDTGRRIITAMALECGGRDEAWLADYLDAFRETWREGRLHKKALVQDVWLWRFALQQSHPQSHSDDPASQQRFMQKFTNLPAGRYGGAHWMVPYRSDNCFGVSVHTSSYYEYWRAAGDWPARKYSYIVGGVCGELSKFGSACSNSHGIPSTTAGQPRHCAYTRRLPGGKWTIENSVSGPTDMHLRLFGRGAWSFTQVYEDTFGGGRERRCSAERYCELAILAENGGADRARVEKFYKAAIECAPRHYPSRRAYSQWLERTGAPLESHRAFVEDTLAKAGAWRQAAWDFAARYLARCLKKNGVAAHAAELARLAPLLRQPDAKMREEASFRKLLSDWTAPECAAAKTDSGRLLASVLRSFLAAQKGTRDYFAQTLGWGCDRMMGNASLAAAYMEAVESVASSSGGKSALDFNMLFGVASRSGNVKTFRQLAALQDKLSPPKFNGQPYPDKDFGGTFLSGDGLLKTSSQAKPDAPRLYPRCIDRSPCEGRTFHTAVEKSPSATVVLPGAAQIAGIVVENRGPADRMRKPLPLVVWVSEDGKSWTEVFSCDKPQQTYRIDVSAKAPRAQYVRVGRRPDARNDGFQLDKILVYGKKLY